MVKVNLSQVKINEANPRIISDGKFTKLLKSILAFPAMLELRPLVIDDKYVTLGGNMRLNVLKTIATMSETDIIATLETSHDYTKMSAKKRKALVKFWGQWLVAPDVPVVRADTLTAEEKRQFIIKDNATFGDWDWETLVADWATDDLAEWGLDIPEEWGLSDDNNDETHNDDKDLSDTLGKRYIVEITLANEQEQEQLYNELNERGLSCRILTL